MGINKLLTQTVIAGGLFICGFYTGTQKETTLGEHTPYKVIKEGDLHFIQERVSGVKQSLNKHFQLGTLDYRLEGIRKEGPNAVEHAKETIDRYYMDIKE